MQDAVGIVLHILGVHPDVLEPVAAVHPIVFLEETLLAAVDAAVDAVEADICYIFMRKGKE